MGLRTSAKLKPYQGVFRLPLGGLAILFYDVERIKRQPEKTAGNLVHTIARHFPLRFAAAHCQPRINPQRGLPHAHGHALPILATHADACV